MPPKETQSYVNHATDTTFLKGKKNQPQKWVSEDSGDNPYSVMLVDVASRYLQVRKLQTCPLLRSYLAAPRKLYTQSKAREMEQTEERKVSRLMHP